MAEKNAADVPRSECYIWNGLTIRRSATRARTRTEAVSLPRRGEELDGLRGYHARRHG